MRAAVYFQARDVRIEDVADPGEPGPGQLRLDVLRAAICGTDASEWAKGPALIPVGAAHAGSGRAAPLVLGHEFVGRVAAVGDGVEGVSVGDRVVPGSGVSCGRCTHCAAGRTNLCDTYYTLGLQADGGLAEAALAPADICVPVPGGCDDDAAAMAQPLAVALHALNRGGARPGAPLAVIGAGGIGALIVGAAAARGHRVIAVDVDGERLATAGRLGAEELVDASREDPAAAIREATGGDGAPVVVEASGAPAALQAAVAAAARGGRVVIVGLQAQPVALDLLDVALREIELTSSLAHVCGSDLPEAVELLASTRIAGEVLGGVIGLDRLVPDGLAALAERRASGKIVVDPHA